MVYGKAEAKKKLGVLTEKNGAFLVSVEKLEEVLTMKSYAAAARDAKRQEAKITEYIAKIVYEELDFDLQESLTEQCGEFEATKKLMIEIKKIKSVQDAISSIKVIADEVCDELTDAEKKILLSDVENIIKEVGDVSDVDIEIRNLLHSAKKDAIRKLKTEDDLNSSLHSSAHESMTSTGQTYLKISRDTIPTFSGDIRHFATFKQSFVDYMSSRGVTDTESKSWLSSEHVMRDKSWCPILLNLGYDEMWAKLEDRFASEVKATARVLRCFNTSKKSIKYGKELEAHYDDIQVAEQYIKKLNNPGDALFVYLMEASEGILPEEVAKDQRRILASMKTADPSELINNLSLHSKMTPPKQVATRAAVNNTIRRDNSDNKNTGERNTSRGGINKKVSCNYCKKDNHKMYKCTEFLKLSPDRRLTHVLTNQMCNYCLSPHHVADGHNGTIYPCRSNGCDESHHFTLHDAMKTNNLGVNMVIRCQGKIGYLGLQLIPVLENSAVTMFDGGANVHLVTEDFVLRTGLKMKKNLTSLNTAGSNLVSERNCLIPMVDRDGDTYIINALVVEKISENISSMLPIVAAQEFNMSKSYFDCIQNRNVDLLIGTCNTKIIPNEIMRTDNALLMRSRFSNGFFTIGTSGEVAVNKNAMVVVDEFTKVKPVFNFLEAEKLGVVAPKRCEKCAGCKSCSYQNDHVTWVEKRDLTEIEKGLT